MKALTVRNVPRRVAEALERERRRSDRSLNSTVLDVLARGLGVSDEGPHSNGLSKLAGTWSAGEQRQFDAAVAAFEDVDPDMWQ